MVFVVAGGARKKANVANTRSLLERLETMVTNYRADVGRYPPDGMDSELVTRDGTELRSGPVCAAAMSVLACSVSPLAPASNPRTLNASASRKRSPVASIRSLRSSSHLAAPSMSPAVVMSSAIWSIRDVWPLVAPVVARARIF